MGIVLAKASRYRFFAEVVSKCTEKELSQFYEVNFLNQQIDFHTKAKYCRVIAWKVFHKHITKEEYKREHIDNKKKLDFEHIFYRFVTSLKKGIDFEFDDDEFNAFLTELGYDKKPHPFKIKHEIRQSKVSQKNAFFQNTKWVLYFTGFYSLSSHQIKVENPNAISKAVIFLKPFGEAELTHYSPETNKKLKFTGSFEISSNEKELLLSLELEDDSEKKLDMVFPISGKDSAEFMLGTIDGISVTQLPQYALIRKLAWKDNIVELPKFYTVEQPEEIPEEYAHEIVDFLNSKAVFKVPAVNINSWEEFSRYLKTFISGIGLSYLTLEAKAISDLTNHSYFIEQPMPRSPLVDDRTIFFSSFPKPTLSEPQNHSLKKTNPVKHRKYKSPPGTRETNHKLKEGFVFARWNTLKRSFNRISIKKINLIYTKLVYDKSSFSTTYFSNWFDTIGLSYFKKESSTCILSNSFYQFTQTSTWNKSPSYFNKESSTCFLSNGFYQFTQTST